MLARGFTLLELMIALAIAAIMMMIGLPSYQLLVDNTKTKGTAESMLSGMRLARAEAIKRNSPMRFQLVSSLSASCAYDTTSSLWVVSQTDQANYGEVAGKCDQATALPLDPCDASCKDNPYIAYKSLGTSRDDPSLVVVADAAVVTFGPLGQVLLNFEGGASLAQVTVSSTNTGAKIWQVQVSSPAGSLKLCDTAIPAGQPHACA